MASCPLLLSELLSTITSTAEINALSTAGFDERHTFALTGTVESVLHGHHCILADADGRRAGRVCGFNPGNHPGNAEGHFGLLDVSERINRPDGTLGSTSSRGRGASIALNNNWLRSCDPPPRAEASERPSSSRSSR